MVKLQYRHPLPDDADPLFLEPYHKGDAQRSKEHLIANGGWDEFEIVLEWTFQILERNPQATFLQAFHTAAIWYFG